MSYIVELENEEGDKVDTNERPTRARNRGTQKKKL